MLFESVALLMAWRWPQAAAPWPAVPKAALEPEVVKEIETIERSLRPNQAADWLRLAEVYRAFGLWPAAEFCYRTADRLQPPNPEYLFFWAVTLSRLGDTTNAAPLFARALTLGVSQTNECRMMLAEDRLREENVAEAESRLREASPSPESTVLLARLLMRSGRVREAMPLLDQALDFSPGDLRLRQMKAWAEQELGHTEAAASQRALALRSRDVMPRKDSVTAQDEQIRQEFGGLRLLRQSQQMEAEQKWEEAKAPVQDLLARGWPETYLEKLAQLELSAGRPAKAIEQIERLFEVSGPNGEAYQLIGQAWLELGEFEKSRRSLLAAERMGANRSATGNLQIQQLLVRVCEKLSDDVARRRHQARVFFELGKLAWLRNDVAQAQQLFQRSTALSGDDPLGWFYLAEANAVLSNQAGAVAAFQRCLQLRPNHGRAGQALDRPGPRP